MARRIAVSSCSPRSRSTYPVRSQHGDDDGTLLRFARSPCAGYQLDRSTSALLVRGTYIDCGTAASGPSTSSSSVELLHSSRVILSLFEFNLALLLLF